MTVREWLRALEAGEEALLARLVSLYGDDATLLAERRSAYIRALRAFLQIYGGGEVLLTRAPGRVNLMGRHVDHRGGHVNPIALNLEVLIVAQRRDDDRVVLHNTDPQFPPREFRLREELPPQRVTADDPQQYPALWDQWTAEQFAQRQAAGTEKDWANYLKAAAVYFQDLFREPGGTFRRQFRGMNLLVHGNVPLSAGLSSSSALFVAAAEALLALNEVHLPVMDFISHCGWGEWYVGTRGGSGDHAAMKLGRRGYISHIGCLPFTVDYVPFPPDYRVIVCDSRDQAHKAGGARNYFNQRVAAYELGFWLLQDAFPKTMARAERLRDVNPETLGVEVAEIYQMLKVLPERMTRAEAHARLPRRKAELEALFAQHDEPAEGYPVRAVCLFGLAECARSRFCFDLLQRGDIAGFGELMRLSHDGDRVVTFDASGRAHPWDPTVPDEELDELIAQQAPLHLQPGGYECSTERIDRMVDLALSVEGVVGAQLSGAGLGGSMMIVARAEAVERVVQRMTEDYYRAYDLPPGINVCVPVEGAGVLAG
ncbi:MAG TPA: hypothetical protein EYP85_10785 [Armatimonadetes bacterium]|nr:hypothetical protein [Armatimonadota bacterium]